MKQYLLLLFLLFLLNSCRNKENICSVIDEVMEKEQLYRKKHSNVLSPYVFILDSLFKSKGYQGGANEYSTYPAEVVLETRNLTKEMLFKRPKVPKTTLDSIWKLQDAVDSLNVLRMIEIIKKNGFEKLDTLENGCAMDGLIVFNHTPSSLIDSVISIVKPDLAKFDYAKYSHILWELYRK